MKVNSRREYEIKAILNEANPKGDDSSALETAYHCVASTTTSQSRATTLVCGNIATKLRYQRGGEGVHTAYYNYHTVLLTKSTRHLFIIAALHEGKDALAELGHGHNNNDSNYNQQSNSTQ